ncbi:MAG: hypothetical protein C4315_12445 [Chloroflexota bacterium]
MTVDPASLDLWESLSRPGCPICRVRRRSERRYAASLLWENVNDPGVRNRLLESQGFCRTHTDLLLRLSDRELGSRLGLAIIYEHLTRELIRRVGGLLKPAGRRRLFGIARAPSARQLRGLLLAAPCPLCAAGREAAERNLWFLVERLPSAEWLRAWQVSDGLCRVHLLRALGIAAQADPEVFDLLWQDALDRLETLRHHLAEFIRKQSWTHRDEPVSAAEAGAVEAAVTFFAGAGGPE